MHANNMQFFEKALFESTGLELQVQEVHFKSGGCINNAVQLRTSAGDFFLKWNENIEEDMFSVEANGLRLLRAGGSLLIPEVLGLGKIEEKHYLLLEYIDSRYQSENYWEQLGHGLAHQHAHTLEQYGLDENNYIGRLPQNNERNSSWVDFFRDARLDVQLGLAIYNGLVSKEFVKKYKSLYPKLPQLLQEEPPALLHGDLWSGNVMVGPAGEPCLIDPAVYFGHREVELAFTELFGGFDSPFYAAYNEVSPLEPGYNERKDIYNIYPLMVHVNLFGTSYLSGVERTINRYV